jgi:hypothetical protein
VPQPHSRNGVILEWFERTREIMTLIPRFPKVIVAKSKYGVRISVLRCESVVVNFLFLALVIAREFNEYANVAVEIYGCPVKIEVPDRDAFVLATNSGVNGFTNDPIHTSKWADVDNAIGTFFIKVNGFPNAENHLSQRPLERQIRFAIVEKNRDVFRFFQSPKVSVQGSK